MSNIESLLATTLIGLFIGMILLARAGAKDIKNLWNAIDELERNKLDNEP